MKLLCCLCYIAAYVIPISVAGCLWYAVPGHSYYNDSFDPNIVEIIGLLAIIYGGSYFLRLIVKDSWKSFEEKWQKEREEERDLFA